MAIFFKKTALIFKIRILKFCEQNDEAFVLKEFSNKGRWGADTGGCIANTR